jgi:hypothetical protein
VRIRHARDCLFRRRIASISASCVDFAHCVEVVSWGGQNKRLARTRRRVVRRLLGVRRSQARLVAKVTLHWLRHRVT